MAKELKDWIDEFIENGANPKNVVNWPEEAGGGSGTKVVTELPQVGEEHTIYELQKKKKIPSLIPRVNQQMVNDRVFDDFFLFVFVFDTSEDMTNTLTSVIPEMDFSCLNYIIKEDKLIMSIYGGTEWQFIEAPKVSDYKFDISSFLGGGGNSVYLVILKEYLGKSSEEGEAVKYTGKLLNDELYTFEPNTFGILLGVPTSGIMVFNSRYEITEIPIDVPEEYTFGYIPYEKIIKNQLAEMFEGVNVLWTFKPNGTGEITSTYWIYTNNKWINVEEIREFETQEKTVNPSTETQEVIPDEGYNGLSKVVVDAVTNNIDANIVAENIRKNVAILGVTGTYQGSGATYTISTLTSKIPQALEAMAVAQIGSNIYLFGGFDKYSSSTVTVNTIYKFNTETETITTLSATLPQKLYNMGVTQVGGDVYLFGGFNRSSGEAVNTIYKFNTETETITTLSVTLPQGLYNMGVAQIGSNVYLFGGFTKSFGESVNTIYKFNTETETITTLSATLPQRLASISVAQIGSSVYLFGGYSGFSGTVTVNTIYKFNTETETITTLSATLPQKLHRMGVTQISSNIYLFGGHAGDSTAEVNTIYKFNTKTETITTLSATLPQRLHSMGVAQVGSNVYLFGGENASVTVNTIYKFSVDF